MEAAASKKRKTELAEGESVFLREILKWDTLSSLRAQQDNTNILDSYESTFSDIANNLLNKAVMVVNGVRHRLVEIEFYYKNGGNHDDPFTHGDAVQLTSGKWYFHRMGNGYKGGSYKGLDITFGGQGPDEAPAHGGILIRAIEPLEGGGTANSLVEGPCKVVDLILQLNASETIADFVATHFEDASAPPAHQTKESRLYLAPVDGASSPTEAKPEDDGPGKEKEDAVAEEKEGEKTVSVMPELVVYKSARVGLSLKREREGLATFVGKHYRYTSRPAWMKKGKPNMIIGLHEQGMDATEIAKVMKTAAKTVTGYIDHYKSGKRKSPSAFMGKALTTQTTCELFGAVCERKE